MFWKRIRRKPGDGSEAAGESSWSLSGRLVAWYACSSFTLVLAVISFLYWSLTRDFQAAADHELRNRAQIMGSLLKQGQAMITELRWEVESEWEELEEPEIFVRILDTQLRPTLATPRLAQLLPVGHFPVPTRIGTPVQPVGVVSPSGRAFRVAAAEVAGQAPGERWVIHVAYDLGQELTMIRKYRYLIAAVLFAAAMLSLVFGYRITRSGLRPLVEIAGTTMRIRSSNLSERVQVAGLPSELAGLADNFNNMLQRLEESFTRLSRFSADIAHELRTPLNILRGEAEVALGRPRSPEEYRDVLVSSLEEYTHLSNIVDSLLFIAQAERTEIPIRRETVEVTEDLRSILEFYEPVIAEKCLTVELESSGPLWAQLDRSLFRRAAGNVISNAISYTPAGGTVLLTASRRNSSIRIEVADTGVGIAPEHLPYVFDRFYRVERARRRGSGGFGLGLSLVKTIMDLHGGSAEIASKPGAGTRLTLVFPHAVEA